MHVDTEESNSQGAPSAAYLRTASESSTGIEDWHSGRSTINTSTLNSYFPEPARMAGSILASRSASLQIPSASVLTASLRALSITPRTQPARSAPPQHRKLSQTTFPYLASRQPTLRPRLNAATQTSATSEAVQATGPGGLVAFQKQQTRGMKVQSSVKKRCEHCKVRS